MNPKMAATWKGLAPLLCCIVATSFVQGNSHGASNQVSESGWSYQPRTPVVPAREAAEANESSQTQARPGTPAALPTFALHYTPLSQPPATNEPVYKGKPLSYWLLVERHLSPLRSTIPGLDENGREAVKAAGTNAIPFLLAWIDSLHAAEAFGVLGPLGKSAIPELAKLATNPPPTSANLSAMRQRNVQESAAAALWRIGADAWPAVTSLITNKAAGDARISLLGAVAWPGTNVLPWTHVLTNCLMDDDIRVVSQALWALRQANPKDKNVFAAIAPILHSPEPKLRSKALETAVIFGDQALPAIVHALSDGDEQVRSVALAELVQTAPQTLTNASVIALGAEGLRSVGQRQKWAAQLLRAAHQQAQGVRPDLTVPLPGGWSLVFSQATNALRQLAPTLLPQTNSLSPASPTAPPSNPSSSQ